MKIKNILMMVLVIFLLIPSSSLAGKESKKVIIFMVDSISMDGIKDLGIEEYGMGLFNLKTRKPYNDENLYRSINVGRKTSDKNLDKEPELEYLGDVLKEENPSYIGGADSSIKLLISNSRDEARGWLGMDYDFNWLDNKLDQALKESDLLVVDYELEDQAGRLESLGKLISKHRDKSIYIIARSAHQEDSMVINKYLVPILKIDGEKGILTSSSTKRKGFLALEDISVDIKENFNKNQKSNIGKTFGLIEEEDNFNKVREIYRENINLLLIATLGHGLVYFSQALLLFYLLTDKLKKLAIFTFIFSTNNIWISFLLGSLNIHSNLILYIIIGFLVNYFISRIMIGDRYCLSISIVATYILVVVGMLFKPEFIYNSYMGFNNLVYGARFYGLNNGIAAVLLATSIFTLMKVDENIYNQGLRNILIGIIPIINLLVLSARFGANTGSFISAILLLLLVYYQYYFSKKVNYRIIIGFILVGLLLFGANMYFDSISSSKSHAVQFLTRIKENGLKEIYHMASFKLKELVKLTIMPPFSLVIICQIMIIVRWSRKLDKGLKIMLLTSILGFCINDTGNILLIYMLNYLILSILAKENMFLA